jgi:beta-glucanase (GH16 family)
MGTRTVGAVACLLGMLTALPAVAAPSVARPEGKATSPSRASTREHRALHLDRPRLSTTRARLTGRASGALHGVELQRRTHHGWRAVGVLSVRDGRFRTHLMLGSKPQRVRVSAGGQHSQVRRIAARRPADACGPRPRKDRTTTWSCTFHDDFDGAALDRGRWRAVTSFSSGNVLGAGACYLDDPSVLSVADGALHLSVRSLSSPMVCPTGSPILSSSYAAGMVSTSGLFSQQYGRFEARYRSAAVSGPGLQEAFWLWPDSRYGADRPWPASGEIDVAETYSVRADLAIPFLHYTANDNGGPIPGTNTAWDCTAWRGEWHTYTLEWSPSRIQVWVDGRSCLVNTSHDAAFDKRYIVNLTAALGIGDNTYGGAFALPATMDVDYVRVWK